MVVTQALNRKKETKISLHCFLYIQMQKIQLLCQENCFFLRQFCSCWVKKKKEAAKEITNWLYNKLNCFHSTCQEQKRQDAVT